MNLNTHQFAFYLEEPFFKKITQGDEIFIKDQDFLHRLIRVIKIRKDEIFILFNFHWHMVVKFLNATRHEIKVYVLFISKNKKLQPHITFLLPLLKKDALEEAVYSLAELGVTDIHLIVTQKSRNSLSQNEMQRLHKIIISAAEQSKNFAFPIMHSMKNLQEIINDLSLESDKVVFEPSGKVFLEIFKQMKFKNKILIIGPEGGLIEEELLMIKEQGFLECSLTPTVLRSLQAAAIGTALFRMS
ncbi:RsmE family RNA methyltransferase [Candidatus Dependentiae bacterium]|nr:RsmE family RNA methyltransferase [Candidatus Dependentiae bacterium]